MGGRVVECARLESVCAAMHRGFESLPIRHFAAGELETSRRDEERRTAAQTDQRSAPQG